MKRFTKASVLVIAVALTSAVAATSGAVRSAQAATEVAASCPTAGALVAYSHLNAHPMGFREVVIRPDGRVWLCWGGNSLNREGLVLGKHQLEALRAQLRLIDTTHLVAPPKRLCCDMPRVSLIVRGTTLPWSGAQPTAAGDRAVRRAEAMLAQIVVERIDLARSMYERPHA